MNFEKNENEKFKMKMNNEKVCGQRLCLCSLLFPQLYEGTGKYLVALRNKEIIGNTL